MHTLLRNGIIAVQETQKSNQEPFDIFKIGLHQVLLQGRSATPNQHIFKAGLKLKFCANLICKHVSTLTKESSSVALLVSQTCLLRKENCSIEENTILSKIFVVSLCSTKSFPY